MNRGRGSYKQIEHNLDTIHDRNLRMNYFYWLLFFLYITVNIVYFERNMALFLLIGIICLTCITLLIQKKLYIIPTMYIMIILFYGIVSINMTLFPNSTDILIIWFGLILSSVYQKERPIILAGLLTLLLTIYHFVLKHSGDFFIGAFQDVVYYTIFGVSTMLVLIYTSRVTEKLRLSAEKNTENVLCEKHHIEELLYSIKESADKKIRHMAYHDGLTGLPNRKFFFEVLTQNVEQAKVNHEQLTIFFLDLVEFKMMNDLMGHTLGDHMLRKVASRITKMIREEDFVARLSGDDFVILLPRTNREEATQIAHEIIKEISKPLIIEDQELYITPCIGISMFPDDGLEAENLIKFAHMAMYRAKEQGATQFQFFIKDLNDEIVTQMMLENDLQKALQRREFSLYYQPKVNINKGKIIGMEALVRWNHPILGTVSPGDFIPLAEKTGIIIAIGEWVLRTACLQNKAWQDNGFPPMVVSVNLSLRQIQKPDFAQTVFQILQETGLKPEYLELEITESLAMKDIQSISHRLQVLKNLGIKISMDDFGTGYSSLSSLNKLPIETLKLDRSFMKSIHNGEEDDSIIAAILAMAKSLRLNVIAEGVETIAQLACLKKLGCNEVQGYIFSKPIPPCEYEKLMKQGIQIPSL